MAAGTPELNLAAAPQRSHARVLDAGQSRLVTHWAACSGRRVSRGPNTTLPGAGPGIIESMETVGLPDFGVCVAVDVHYPRTGVARAAADLASEIERAGFTGTAITGSRARAGRCARSGQIRTGASRSCSQPAQPRHSLRLSASAIISSPPRPNRSRPSQKRSPCRMSVCVRARACVRLCSTGWRVVIGICHWPVNPAISCPEVAVLDDLRCSAGDSQRPEAQELPGDRQRLAWVRAGQEFAGRKRDLGAR